MTPVILPGYDDPRKLRRRLFASKGQGLGHPDELGQKQMLEKLDSRWKAYLTAAHGTEGFEALSALSVDNLPTPGKKD